ncbi:MAG TPA: hypothetical protein VNR00_00935 [Opitutus sp.]|nr:hypothetical protein [Opitutus sp.]
MNSLVRRMLSVGLFAAAVLIGRAHSAVPPPAVAVGVMNREFADPARRNWADTASRPVRVTLWYPAGEGGTPENCDDEGEPVTLRREAAIASDEPRPLILVSHGSGGNAAQMLWLGRFLAQQGFLVAAVNHNGTAEEELDCERPTLTDFFGWERARDVSVALDGLLADSALAARIDRERIGAAGFSLGGTTALWLAGARLDLELLRQNSPPPPPPMAAAIQQRIEFSKTNPVGRDAVARAALSYRDERVRAVFALAPPMGGGFAPAGLRDIAVPVLLVVGEGDLIAPAESNAKHFAEHISTAWLTILPGERGHYLKPLPAEQRRAELREVAELAGRFFEQELR